MVKGFQLTFFIAHCWLLMGVNFAVSNEIRLTNIDNFAVEILVEDLNEADTLDHDIDDGLSRSFITEIKFTSFETTAYIDKYSPYSISYYVHIRAPPILTV